MSKIAILACNLQKNSLDSSKESWNFRAYAGQSCRWLSRKTKKLWLFSVTSGKKGFDNQSRTRFFKPKMSLDAILACDLQKNSLGSSKESWNFRANAGQSCRLLSRKIKKLWLFRSSGGGGGQNKASPPCTGSFFLMEQNKIVFQAEFFIQMMK